MIRDMLCLTVEKYLRLRHCKIDKSKKASVPANQLKQTSVKTNLYVKRPVSGIISFPGVNHFARQMKCFVLKRILLSELDGV